MNLKEKKETAGCLVSLVGWLWIINAIVYGLRVTMKVVQTPIENLQAKDVPLYTPLVIAALLGLGIGILRRREWIRGVVVWILGIYLVVFVPVGWFSKYTSLINLIPNFAFSLLMLFLLTRDVVKQQFQSKLKSEEIKETV